MDISYALVKSQMARKGVDVAGYTGPGKKLGCQVHPDQGNYRRRVVVVGAVITAAAIRASVSATIGLGP